MTNNGAMPFGYLAISLQQVGRNSDSVLRRMIEGQIRRNACWLLRPTRYAVLGEYFVPLGCFASYVLMSA